MATNLNQNATGLMDFFTYINSITHNFLGIGILIMLGAIAFLSTKNYSNDRAFSFAAFVCLLSAILLRFINLVNDTTLGVVIVIFILSVVFIMKERRDETYV